MGRSALSAREAAAYDAALDQARTGLDEGGVPVGAALLFPDGEVVAGRNRRVQSGDPIAHGEMDCLRAAGRRTGYRDATLFTTLSPCVMCTGTIELFQIGRVVIGESSTFRGPEERLTCEVIRLDDPQARALMEEFQRRHPDIWSEDIGGR